MASTVRTFDELEACYWSHYESGEVDECLKLVNEIFLGCDSTGKALGKSDLESNISDIRRKIDKDPMLRKNPDIEIVDEIVLDDVAMVLLTRHGGKKLVTHTWRQSGTGWLLLGGMSQNI